MAIHPGTRLLQLALGSLGHDPGPVDGWHGARTQAAAAGLLARGPARSSQWAVATLHRGLADLGHYEGDIAAPYGEASRAALSALLAANGAAKASAAPTADVRLPTKPELRPQTHGNAIQQGSKVIDHFMMHTTATPGGWPVGKTNRDMLEAVRQMHTLPVSRGGRGWSDIGYHYLICPDGEVMVGRPITRTGAGAIGYNAGVCHAAMIPVRTITRMGRPADFYTPETLASMRALIEHIAAFTPIRRLSGHNEVAAKLCPGFPVVDRDWTDRAVI
jgi:hypothetical protein